MPIGAICAWPHGVTYPTGWVLCDGTANAAGSGLDLRGRFLVGWDGSHSANGGGLTHTHAGHSDHSGVLAHDHDQMRHATATGALSGLTTAPDTSSSNPGVLGPKTGVTGSGSAYAHSAHDGPNSEPPYSPIDWIERLT